MVSGSHLSCRSSSETLGVECSGDCCSRLADFAGEELAELNQVSTVALDGVVAECFSSLQVVEELLDQR